MLVHMRKETDTLESLPSGVANFDQPGIRFGLDQMNQVGALPTFVGQVNSGPLPARDVLNRVWLMPPGVGGMMNDTSKVTTAYNQSSLSHLPANPTPEQVVGATIDFLAKLFS